MVLEANVTKSHGFAQGMRRVCATFTILAQRALVRGELLEYITYLGTSKQNLKFLV